MCPKFSAMPASDEQLAVVAFYFTRLLSNDATTHNTILLKRTNELNDYNPQWQFEFTQFLYDLLKQKNYSYGYNSKRFERNNEEIIATANEYGLSMSLWPSSASIKIADAENISFVEPDKNDFCSMKARDYLAKYGLISQFTQLVEYDPNAETLLKPS